MEFPEPLEAWPNPHPHPGALVSQEETNSLVKVKSYIFACKLTCVQTDDISLQPGITSRSPQKLQSEVSPMGWTTAWDPFPN